MRTLMAIVTVAAACVPPAAALETTRQLIQNGAPRLALDRVQQLQPRDPKDPRWPEWETLRFSLLATLGRDEEVLARAAALPPALPERELREALTMAVRAAVAAGRGPLARRYAARALWELNAGADETRVLRLAVIESYVAERDGDAAFRAMLRFQQDYQPLDRGVAARFVEALLDLGMEHEAVNWLASLDDAGAAKLLLRLRANLVSAESALAEARTRLAKGADAGYWRVIAEAGARQGTRALQIEATERQLQLAQPGARTAVLAAALWQLYVAGAQETANRNQLLGGDDAAWSDFAARRLGTDPFLARAYFAYLAQRGQTPATRRYAQLQLVFLLHQDKLDLAALRLFEHGGIEVAALDAQARYLLGAAAEARNEPVLAVRFWEGLETPPNVGADLWHMRLAAVNWRAGRAEAAMSDVRRALEGNQAPTAEAMRRAGALSQEMLAAGWLGEAGMVLEVLLPRADAGLKRDILFTLGRVAEASGRFPSAADFYLRSALLAGSGAPDAAALQARLAAALNLARAGYREDARAQFQWVLRNSRDAAQLEIARRELANL